MWDDVMRCTRTHINRLWSACMENSLNWVIINDSKSSQIEYEMDEMNIYLCVCVQQRQFFCRKMWNFFYGAFAALLWVLILHCCCFCLWSCFYGDCKQLFAPPPRLTEMAYWLTYFRLIHIIVGRGSMRIYFFFRLLLSLMPCKHSKVNERFIRLFFTTPVSVTLNVTQFVATKHTLTKYKNQTKRTLTINESSSIILVECDACK